MDSRGPDHGADSCRYACLHRPATFGGFDPREIFDPVPENVLLAQRARAPVKLRTITERIGRHAVRLSCGHVETLAALAAECQVPLPFEPAGEWRLGIDALPQCSATSRPDLSHHAAEGTVAANLACRSIPRPPNDHPGRSPEDLGPKGV